MIIMVRPLKIRITRIMKAGIMRRITRQSMKEKTIMESMKESITKKSMMQKTITERMMT